MRNIVLTGFMGTGKSSVGRELARRLGMRLVELDAEIEKAEGTAISEIFSRHGETYFRDRETEMARRFAAGKNLVISTGGGIVMREENMNALREGGVIVCLSASPETILERTGTSDERPLLQVDDPAGEISVLLEKRRPFYEKADIMIDTDAFSPAEIAERIIDEVKTLYGKL